MNWIIEKKEELKAWLKAIQEKKDPFPEVSLMFWSVLTGMGLMLAAIRGAEIFWQNSLESDKMLFIDVLVGIFGFLLGVMMVKYYLREEFGISATNEPEKELSEPGKILAKIYDNICILLNAEDETPLNFEAVNEVVVNRLKLEDEYFKHLVNMNRDIQGTKEEKPMEEKK